MSLFHSILSQLQEKITKETDHKETIVRIVSEVLHTPVTPDQIVVRDTTLRIKVPPTLKMVVQLKTKKLLAALQEASIDIKIIQ